MWWPYTLLDTGPCYGLASECCLTTDTSKSQDSEYLYSCSLSWVLDPVKLLMTLLSSCPFRCETLIAAPRTSFPLTWHFAQTNQGRNTTRFVLTCPERGLEQRWACLGGRSSATSAPTWGPPASSSPGAALGHTDWAPRSLRKARGCETHPPSSAATDSVKTEQQGLKAKNLQTI